MNTRLKDFLRAENITQSQFADKIGVARASVSHILSGRNKPGYDFLESLVHSFPDLNIEWLITGRGKMYSGGRAEGQGGRVLQNIDNDADTRRNTAIQDGNTQNIGVVSDSGYAPESVEPDEDDIFASLNHDWSDGVVNRPIPPAEPANNERRIERGVAGSLTEPGVGTTVAVGDQLSSSAVSERNFKTKTEEKTSKKSISQIIIFFEDGTYRKVY